MILVLLLVFVIVPVVANWRHLHGSHPAFSGSWFCAYCASDRRAERRERRSSR